MAVKLAPKKKKLRGMVVIALLLIIAAVGFWPHIDKPFRLHILANSNNAIDQQVKLKVRDAVLSATAQGIKQCKNASQAEEYIREDLGIILETADETLKANGFDYKSTATVGNYRFPDRTYCNVTYPAGDYEAVRIILGEGKGDNWWCVIFPPLCLSETDGGAGNVQYTSFFAELWKDVFGEATAD